MMKPSHELPRRQLQRDYLFWAFGVFYHCEEIDQFKTVSSVILQSKSCPLRVVLQNKYAHTRTNYFTAKRNLRRVNSNSRRSQIVFRVRSKQQVFFLTLLKVGPIPINEIQRKVWLCAGIRPITSVMWPIVTYLMRQNPALSQILRWNLFIGSGQVLILCS